MTVWKSIRKLTVDKHLHHTLQYWFHQLKKKKKSTIWIPDTVFLLCLWELVQNSDQQEKVACPSSAPLSNPNKLKNEVSLFEG